MATKVSALLGLVDEPIPNGENGRKIGKEKLVDVLCASAQICARSAGGDNAGHTIVANGVTYDFPVRSCEPQLRELNWFRSVSPATAWACLSSRDAAHRIGTVVHVPSFFKELHDLQQKGLNTEGRILISDQAHLTLDLHTVIDGSDEQELGRGAVGHEKGDWTVLQLPGYQTSSIKLRSTGSSKPWQKVQKSVTVNFSRPSGMTWRMRLPEMKGAIMANCSGCGALDIEPVA